MNIQKVTSRLGEGRKETQKHYTALQWWFYFSPEGGECWIIVQKEQWQQSSSGEQWKSIMGFPSHAIRVEQGFWQTHETTNGFGGNIFHSTSPSASAPSPAPAAASTSVSVGGNPAQPSHHRGRRKGHRGQDLGFRDLLSSGLHPAPAGSEHRHCSPSSTCWVAILETLAQSWRSPKTTPQVALKGQGKTSSLTSALWVQLLIGPARSPLIKVHQVQCTEGVEKK